MLCGFQSTLWFQITGGIPAPLFWLNLVVYLSIEKKPFVALALIQFIGWIVAAFTATHIGVLQVTLFILFWLIYLIRSRIYWPGSMYYSFISFIAVVAFQVIYILTSLLIEKNAASILFWDRTIQILLTPLFSFFMYSPIKKLDRLFQTNTIELDGFES